MRSNLDTTQASASAGTARPLSLLAAILLLAATAAAALLLMTSAQGQQIKLEECTAEQEAAGECGEDVHELQPEPAPAPQPAPAPAPSQPGETHEYDLRSGEGTVESADGEVEDETLEVDLSPDEAGPDGDEHGREHREEDDEPLVSRDIGLSSVSTTGGSGFAGFGADFLSGDEALARFAVPPFLIPIYVAAGRAYDVPWNVLAAINQIETDFGRIRHQVSYAGARGWMQFMPGTWRAYGVDASGDGVADPYNPVDAIYAAARYLSASGAPEDLRRAVFAYNHADWYVDRVLRTASIYGSLPSGLLAETGSLAFGRFPLVGRVTYGDDFRRAQAAGSRPQGLWIAGRERARAIATQNVRVVHVLLDQKLAGAFRRRGSVESRGVAPVRTIVTASAGAGTHALRAIEPRREELRALPKGYALSPAAGVGVVVEDNLGNRYSYAGLERIERDARPGARLRGGEPLGHVGPGSRARLLFSVRAAGGAPVDPRPLVDGYRLQEVADFYNAVAPLGGNPFVLEDGESIQGVSGTARQLAARVLSDPGIDIYAGGRDDVQRGVIDKRTMGALLYLRRNGLELTVTSLRSGHSFYTAGGGVSAHSFGAAVDIAAFNGQPVIGHQGPGSLTEQAVRLLMQLQGEARPSQLISLMSFGGPSFAMGDHHDHLHVGYSFEPSLGAGRSGNVLSSVDFAGGGGDLFAKADVPAATEAKLSRKLSQIENPAVSRKRGAGALHVEAESPRESAEAEELARRRRGPLTVQPASAGAHVADVDVPARGEAWAVGTVDGGGWDGWAPEQTVVTRYAGGTWRVVGPARGAGGRIANPRLRALATVRGGRGYAVGDRGAVVELRGVKPPRLIASGGPRLNAVDVRVRGGSLEGVAVGAKGTALRLTGSRAVRERAGTIDLTAVQLDGGGALAAGGRSRGTLLRRGAGGWSSDASDFGLPSGLRARVTALDRRGSTLWVVGGVSDSAAAGAAELPFAARLSAGGWHTFCAGRPALAAVKELGTPTSRRVCHSGLTSDPSDTGAATDVAVTARGAVVSTSRGLHLHTRTGFQPVAVGPDGYERLALSSAARGWAVASGGRIAYVRPAGLIEGAGFERLPLASGGRLAAVAESPDGERTVAIASGQAALREGGRWTTVEGPVVGLRALAFSDETAWATDETGALLQLSDGRWEAWGESAVQEEMRESLVDSLGGELVAADGQATSNGFGALSFAPNGQGYAVGTNGLVIRYDDGDWELQETPAAVSLHAVAATNDVAVAGGDQGALVEDTGDGWGAPEEPRRLVGNRVFTALDAMSDGTVLAAAGGMLIERSTDGEWVHAGLQPLGVHVQRLAGFRGHGGELRAVALVGEGDALALLQAGPDGWSTVDLPAGLRIADFALRRDNLQLSLIGYRDGAPVALRTKASAR